MILRATLVRAAKALGSPSVGGDLRDENTQEQLKRMHLDPKQADEIRACGEALAQGQQFTRLVFSTTTAWATFLAMERGIRGEDETRPSFCVQRPKTKLYPIPWTGNMSDVKQRERIANAMHGMSDSDRALIIAEPGFVIKFFTSLILSPDDLVRVLQQHSFDIAIEGTVIQYIPQT